MNLQYDDPLCLRCVELCCKREEKREGGRCTDKPEACVRLANEARASDVPARAADSKIICQRLVCKLLQLSGRD